MSLLDSFIECCECERDELRHQLIGLEFNGSWQEIDRLKQSIADLDRIIAYPVPKWASENFPSRA